MCETREAASRLRWQVSRVWWKAQIRPTARGMSLPCPLHQHLAPSPFPSNTRRQRRGTHIFGATWMIQVAFLRSREEGSISAEGGMGSESSEDEGACKTYSGLPSQFVGPSSRYFLLKREPLYG